MQKEKNVRDKVFSGIAWKFAERFLAQGVSFVISVILARILAPELYGTVAIIMVFIGIANVFTTGGFSMALIRKKDADEEDFSTIFYCTLAMSILLYGLLWVFSPILAKFYNIPELKWLMRVFSVSILINSYNSIQHAYVSRNMIFKKFFFSTMFGTVLSGIVGIIMATLGAGVWALVAQYLTNTVVDTLVLSFTVHWRPRLVFSKKSYQELMAFGWKCLAANLIGTIYNNLRALLIGKFYTSADLAYYNKGKSFPDMISGNMSATVFAVLFPAISNASDSLPKVKEMTGKVMRLSSYVIFPMMVGLAAVADTMVPLLLTDKWNACIPFLRFACIYSMFHLLTDINIQSINAIGRSDVVLRLEFIKKPVTLIMILCALQINVMAIGISLPLSSLFTMLVNMYFSGKLIGYRFWEQVKDILAPVIYSAVMAASVWAVGMLKLPGMLLLIVQVAVGCVVYIGLSALKKDESFIYLKTYLVDFYRRLSGRGEGKNPGEVCQ